jgi:hypothetical protein
MSVRSDPFEAGYDDGGGFKRIKNGISAAASLVWLPGAKGASFCENVPQGGDVLE